MYLPIIHLPFSFPTSRPSYCSSTASPTFYRAQSIPKYQPRPLQPWTCSPASASPAPGAASTSAGTKSPHPPTAKTTSATASRRPSAAGKPAATSTGMPRPTTTIRAPRPAKRTRNAANASARRNCEKSKKPRRMRSRAPWDCPWCSATRLARMPWLWVLRGRLGRPLDRRLTRTSLPRGGCN